MILVDTSVWVDHFRRTELELVRLLDDGQVLIHPFIVGELACGNLKNRHEILSLLGNLPASKVANQEEVLELIERRKLMGLGIGYVDAHLLATTLLSEARLWTKDKRLAVVAKRLSIAA